MPVNRRNAAVRRNRIEHENPDEDTARLCLISMSLISPAVACSLVQLRDREDAQLRRFRKPTGSPGIWQLNIMLIEFISLRL